MAYAQVHFWKYLWVYLSQVLSFPLTVFRNNLCLSFRLSSAASSGNRKSGGKLLSMYVVPSANYKRRGWKTQLLSRKILVPLEWERCKKPLKFFGLSALWKWMPDIVSNCFCSGGPFLYRITLWSVTTICFCKYMRRRNTHNKLLYLLYKSSFISVVEDPNWFSCACFYKLRFNLDVK